MEAKETIMQNKKKVIDPIPESFATEAEAGEFWDTHSTVFSVGLQAMTPAGLDANGAATGPTHICPNFAWLYDIGGGAAVHGFVGQNLRTGAHWDDHLVRALKYGFALQGPTLGSGCDRTYSAPRTSPTVPARTTFSMRTTVGSRRSECPTQTLRAARRAAS